MAKVAGPWIKAAASSPSGNCVELADLDNGAVALRNSREPEKGHLEFTKAEIAAFIQGATEGDFARFTN